MQHMNIMLISILLIITEPTYTYVCIYVHILKFSLSVWCHLGSRNPVILHKHTQAHTYKLTCTPGLMGRQYVTEWNHSI